MRSVERTSATTAWAADEPAKGTAVPLPSRFGDVQERSRATNEDRPVAGVEIMCVLFTSSTSFAALVVCR